MSKLVIVESPAKAKTIKKYLGTGYDVVASVGHIRDLPKSTLGIDVENGFKVKYINMSDKKEVISKLKAAAKKADAVYLATDPDREGEAISWHLAHILGLDTAEQNRVTFNEITKTGVKNGMASPRSIDLNLVDAQQARRVLDRLVGYKLSPFLWKKVRRGLSAGRVQSVALKLIVDREKEIRNFVPEEYWTVEAELLKEKHGFVAKLYGTADGKKIDTIKTGDDADGILNKLTGAKYTVSRVKKGVKTRQPAPPFNTSTLQQEASRKLGFTGRRTMSTAQTLYEGVEIPGIGTTGLITYMRTDSLRISEEARAAATAFIRDTYGENYLPQKPRYFKTKNNAQDAHEAIRPTIADLTPERVKSALTPDQYKLYKLIWDRFTASLMAACIHDTVSVDISAADYIFRASGYSVKFDGYTKIYVEGVDEEEKESGKLPKLSEGDELDLKKLIPTQHFTQPPARYTEPTLIKTLDENGVGRPSTYVPIISNIITREYIEREKKSLKPTQLGETVSDLITEYFNKIINVKFTANMETSFDKIESGNLQWVEAIKKFYEDFEVLLQKAEKSLDGQRIKVPEEETDVICENCGRHMVIKSGRFGKFLACPGYPECKNTKPIVNEMPGACPKCGGKILQRSSKKGYKYYGCENGAKCGFMTWDIPLKDTCPKCGKTLFKQRGGIIHCLNEGCDYQTESKSKSKSKTKPEKEDKE